MSFSQLSCTRLLILIILIVGFFSAKNGQAMADTKLTFPTPLLEIFLLDINIANEEITFKLQVDNFN